MAALFFPTPVRLCWIPFSARDQKALTTPSRRQFVCWFGIRRTAMHVKTISVATIVGGLFADSQGKLTATSPQAVKGRQRTRRDQPPFKVLARRTPSAQARKQTEKPSRRELTGSLVQRPTHGLRGADGAWKISRSRRGYVSDAEAAGLELHFEAAADRLLSRCDVSLLGGAALCAIWLLHPAPAEASAAAAAAGSAVDAGFWTKYWFMLPTATCVATSCLLSGIGGAALFSPIFLLVFPLLGPQYPLGSPAAAFTTALLTECFGFSSGLIGYFRRGLVDFASAAPFVAIGVPFGERRWLTLQQDL
ncbi:hypothetical protein CYMTET_27259 [Cymbomonas tetramitiformis]|uniref:Uncharacterized protein n=1 Tax=Cymbomonas tetramitiformis TaxID=36881 RepID=A0AAE0KX27_9CHLO|nr:hypothetical protein CYMTET_27259 [Cymbomonas tetramitiformis]